MDRLAASAEEPSASAATADAAARLRALEDRHSDGMVRRRGTTVLARGEGCWVWDVEGRRYLDLTAAQGVAPLGHSHPRLVAAITEQAQRLVACPQFLYNDRRAELLGELATLLPPHLPRVCFTNSGAEAIEAGIKLARLATGRTRLVALRGAFHGRTTGALSLTWNPGYREPFAPLLPGVVHVPSDDPAALAAAVDGDTAAVVVEVIQGEGGVRPVSPALLDEAQRLCRAHGALLFIDEIQTGLGRTGTWLSHRGVGLEPDLIALGKGIAGGLPLGVLAFGERVAASTFVGAHGSTFAGNPLAAAAALATLRTLRDEALPARAAALGDRLSQALRAALTDRPLVREVRGRGLMLGIELRTRVAPYLRALAEEHGILALPAGPTVLRLLPPLVLSDDEADAAVRALTAVLAQEPRR